MFSFFTNFIDPLSVSLGEECSKDFRGLLLFNLMVQFRIGVVGWHFVERSFKTLL